MSTTDIKDLFAAFQLLTKDVEEYSMILLDEQGTILTWNKGVEKLKGYKAEEIIGQNISIFYLPEDRNAGLANKLLTEAKEKGHATFFGRRLRKNGTIFWGKIEITAVKDKSGKFIGFTKLARELKEETTIGHFWFDNDGVFHIKASPIPYDEQTIQEWRENIRSVLGSKKVCCIADMREAVISDAEKTFGNPDIKEIYKAVAFITSMEVDPVTSAIINVLPKEVPVRTFISRESAKAWIKLYIE